MKQCTKCAIKKELKFFSRDKRQKDGHFYYCKECCAIKDKARYGKQSVEIGQAAKEHYANNKTKVRNRHLQKMYGIDLEHYNEMRKQQLFSCLICNTHEDDLPRSLFVDHCHTTGRVRGLLCRDCNFLLGLARDSKETLEKAIKYLNKETL